MLKLFIPFLIFFSTKIPVPIKFRAFEVCVKMEGYKTDCFETENLVVVNISGKKVDVYASKELHYDLTDSATSEKNDKNDLIVNMEGVGDDGRKVKIKMIIFDKPVNREAANLLLVLPDKEVLYRMKEVLND